MKRDLTEKWIEDVVNVALYVVIGAARAGHDLRGYSQESLVKRYLPEIESAMASGKMRGWGDVYPWRGWHAFRISAERPVYCECGAHRDYYKHGEHAVINLAAARGEGPKP